MDTATFVDHTYFRRELTAVQTCPGQKDCSSQSVFLSRFSQSPEDLQFYTGFSSLEHLMAFWRIIAHATKKIGWPEIMKSSNADENQVDQRNLKGMVPFDQFLLFMTYLATGWTMTELSWHFNIHTSTFTRLILTWTNFLYFLLGSVRSWMTPEQVKANLPREFIDHIDTQVVIDCIELHCETASSMLPHQSLCPSHKSCCMLRGIVGMAPHGAVMFVSMLSGLFMSARDIFRQSGIIPLLSSEMAVMVNKDFSIDDLVPGQVYHFESGKNHTSNVSKSQAALRVHVEKLSSIVRENKVFNTCIPSSLSGSINQLFTVACLICNYQRGPLGTKFKQED